MADLDPIARAEDAYVRIQQIYEAILGYRLDKNSFRRRIVASGLVAPVGRRREGLRFRPSELFRFLPAAVET